MRKLLSQFEEVARNNMYCEYDDEVLRDDLFNRVYLFEQGFLNCIEINDSEAELRAFMKVQAEFAEKDNPTKYEYRAETDDYINQYGRAIPANRMSEKLIATLARGDELFKGE